MVVLIKNVKRLLFSMMLVLIIIMASVEVMAAGNVVGTLYPKKDKGYDFFLKKMISRNEIGTLFNDVDDYPKSITSTNKSVAEPGKKYKKWGLTYTYVKLKKVGTTTIINNDYNLSKYQLTVRKYVNPFASLFLNKKQIAGKFKKSSVIKLSYKKYKNKKIRIKYSLIPGWYDSGYLQLQKKGSSNCTVINNGESVKITNKKMVFTFTQHDMKGQTTQCQICFK